MQPSVTSMPTFNKVLVATDLSAASRAAFQSLLIYVASLEQGSLFFM
jgi:hypothetical protein